MHQTSGTLGVSTVPDRASGLHIAYLSQQQLRSFNLPYQLGFSDLPNTPNSFESPSDADTASISGNYINVYVYIIVCLMNTNRF